MAIEKTVTVSWFSRLKDSIGGVLVGLVLIVAMVVMLFWNEGRAVRVAKALAEGASSVVEVASEKVDAANEAKLVHISGQAETSEPLADTQFGVSTSALQLRRRVEMYQWAESSRTEKKVNLGGSETQVTTYEYDKRWSSQWSDSSRFQEPFGHINPSMDLDDAKLVAPEASLGAWRLDAKVLERLGGGQKLALKAEDAPMLPQVFQGKKARIVDGMIYLGEIPASPEVGDYRITYEVVPTGPLSAIGRQKGNTLETYPTKSGEQLLIVQTGLVDAATMFQAAERGNVVITWIFRGLGLLLLTVGFAAVFRPLSVAGSVLPLFGRIVGAASGLVAVVCGLAVAGITIAIAWLFYRPLLAIALIVLVVGLIVAAVWLLRGRAARMAASAA